MFLSLCVVYDCDMPLFMIDNGHQQNKVWEEAQKGKRKLKQKKRSCGSQNHSSSLSEIKQL